MYITIIRYEYLYLIHGTQHPLSFNFNIIISLESNLCYYTLLGYLYEFVFRYLVNILSTPSNDIHLAAS
jgi:hypothetical protein